MDEIKHTHEGTNQPDKELQKIHERQERESLLFATEALLPEISIDKEIEKIQLRNGVYITKDEIDQLVRSMASDYFPMFPNSSPFFKLMFKLKGFKSNPNDFIKPSICGLYIKQYIYARFPKEILPSLLMQENPLITGYVKKYKLFQFLNDAGRLMMEGFIQDAINVMEESENWYDFELKYTKKFQLYIQLKCFPDQSE